MEHSIIREKVAQSTSPFPVIYVFAWRHVCVVFLVAHTVTLVDVLKSVKKQNNKPAGPSLQPQLAAANCAGAAW